MNVNAGIIDIQVRGLATRLHPRLEETIGKKLDETTARSIAFVVLCEKTMLDLDDDEAIEVLTEGSRDFGVDAIHVSDITDGEFTVTLFQGKYHHADLDGVKAMPEDAVLKAVQAVRTLFDPGAALDVNPRLQARVAEIRSIITDGVIPTVRFILCSNGQPWSGDAQAIIDREGFPDGVVFEHVNHDRLLRVLQSTQPIRDTLEFAGKTLTEDLNYTRVFLGKIAVSELARLLREHGERLLERNVRRYLGLHGNRVNEAIRRTLHDPAQRENFYFYNNGVTFICQRFEHNALQRENHKVRVEGLQVINGGQTSMTIHRVIDELVEKGENLDQVHVLVRLYQVPSDSAAFVQNITLATNSQSPVDLKDLRSNDERQRSLELGMTPLGYEYRRHRSDESAAPSAISSGTVAEAVLAVWRKHPQQAKFRSGDHFGRLYDEIFTEGLNASQAIVAVLLHRIAEAKRKRPPPGAPAFVPYASCFASMLMGRYLLEDLKVDLAALDHRNFAKAKLLIEERGEAYFARCIEALEAALKALYGDRAVSLQQLSATFRRGDLLTYLA